MTEADLNIPVILGTPADNPALKTKLPYHPERDFAPSPGRLDVFQPPSGPFVRVDTHGYPGWRVPPDYDSLLAKVIVWAPDREQAIDRMTRALHEFAIDGPGVHTTRDLLREVLAHKVFRAGEHTTSFLDNARREAEGALPALLE